MVAGNRLLGLLLGDLVGLGGDEGDELDAALYEEVAGLFGEDAAARGGEDLGDDLLDRRWGDVSIVGEGERERRSWGGGGGGRGLRTLWETEVVVRCDVGLACWCGCGVTGKHERVLMMRLERRSVISHSNSNARKGRYRVGVHSDKVEKGGKG